MKITMELARKVLYWVRQGLGSGLGDGEYRGDMCVQHAVARAIGEAEEGSPSDAPSCVDNLVRDLGINLNDAGGWTSEGARARGLQRLAVAELGTTSNNFLLNKQEFRKRLWVVVDAEFEDEAMEGGWSATTNPSYWDFDSLSSRRLAAFANRVADILEEMKTPGSEYLCMVDWTNQELAKPVEDEDAAA